MYFGNKKSNAVIDTMVVFIVLTVFAVVAILGYHILGNVKPMLQSTMVEEDVSYQILEKNTTRYVPLFDNLVVFIFIMLWINAIIASFMIDTHPIYFAVTIVLLVFVIIAGVFVSNFYTDLTQAGILGETAANFVKSNWIMRNLLAVTIAIGMSVTFVLYGKLK